MRIATVVAVLAILPGAALAEDRATLQAKGEQLAKDGHFVDAIDAFKAADKIEPRAIHACLISLAYQRRELWPQAELFLSICHQRANATDPLPDWVPLADQQVRDRLNAANMVEVSIETKPANAKVTVSSFAPDEVFEPRTIHLPLGSHVIFAHADGYVDGQTTLQLTSKTPKHVVIELAPVAGGNVGEPIVAQSTTFVPEQPGARTTGSGKRGTPLLIAGGAAIVLGAASHGWMAYERSQLVKANEQPTNQQLYDDHSGRFDIARIATIGLYAAGLACLGIGFYERSHSPEKSATVAAVPLAEGGALVSVGWQR